MTEAVGCMIGGLVMLAAIKALAHLDALLLAVTNELRRDDQ